MHASRCWDGDVQERGGGEVAGQGGGRVGIIGEVWLFFVVCWLVKALATDDMCLEVMRQEGQLTYLVLPLVGFCKECFEQHAAREQSFLVHSFPSLF